MNPLTKNRLIGLALAVLLFAADQATKGYILNVLQLDLGQSHYIMPIFQFTLTHNYGVSLGMLTATSQEMRWGLVALTSVIAVVVTVWMVRETLLADIIPLAMILGGALGNIHDRILRPPAPFRGEVVDFLELPNWPVFNIADMGVVGGALLIVLLGVIGLHADPAAGDAEDAATAEAESPEERAA